MHTKYTKLFTLYFLIYVFHAEISAIHYYMYNISIFVHFFCNVAKTLIISEDHFKGGGFPVRPHPVYILALSLPMHSDDCYTKFNALTYIYTDSRNQLFSLILNSTIPANRTVACTQLTRGAGTFECEFCYSAGDSCPNLMTCISVSETPTVLPNLTELTYCYRATANISGTAVAVIQDTFNTGIHR